jgi:hypothetical protein
MASKKQLKNMLLNVRLRNSKQRKKPGSAPGTIKHGGERHMDEIQINVHDYDEDSIQEISIDKIQKVKPFLEAPSKTWINVRGLHDTEKLQSIWNFFNLHPLIQEDIVNTSQRPKVEIYDNCIFFVLRLLSYSKEDGLETEQISIVLGENYVMSFQETGDEHFKPILNRLAVEGSRIRKKNADYLAYALIDTVVDYYFNILEYVADDIADTGCGRAGRACAIDPRGTAAYAPERVPVRQHERADALAEHESVAVTVERAGALRGQQLQRGETIERQQVAVLGTDDQRGIEFAALDHAGRV